jgi:hypothetical protein
MNMQLAHHFAQRDSHFVRRNKSLPTLTGFRIKGRFAKVIPQQNQPSVGHSEFRQTDSLRSDIESNKTRRAGHELKHQFPNPRANFNTQIFNRSGGSEARRWTLFKNIAFNRAFQNDNLHPKREVSLRASSSV